MLNIVLVLCCGSIYVCRQLDLWLAVTCLVSINITFYCATKGTETATLIVHWQLSWPNSVAQDYSAQCATTTGNKDAATAIVMASHQAQLNHVGEFKQMQNQLKAILE